ncbi:MAG: precorrin-3B C(17)-methyltransferase, partial [Lachnospiraceae bacterium]|nr:precorrin-3B C(17)-methyltransferase [Lachnospiraceae bacterium]
MKIYVVGIGPGREEYMTHEASRVLDGSDTIIGYKVYIDLVRDRYSDKELLTTGMRDEVRRCELCIEKAAEGKTVSLICSGDAGVYGMASLMLSVAKDNPKIGVEVVPGVTAALSGSALLGAPVGHDFCVISLSDLLTPRELIEKRLRCAAEADFVIVIYNPSSKGRPDHLKRALDIIREYTGGDRICGIA